MTKKILLGLFCIFMLEACSVEQVNLSPISQSLANTKNEQIPHLKEIAKSVENNAEYIKYAAELSNAAEALPRFSTKHIDKPIDAIKFNVSEYLYATREYNENRRARTLYKLQNAYKKIQKLRKYLTPEEDETLNFYLVKIKTNITLIEANKNSSNK